MNGFLISVVILLACAAGTAIAIRRLGRAVESERSSYLYPEASRLAYRALGRLRAVDDERFLKSQQGFQGALRQRLHSERSVALGLYLDQIKDEFEHACGHARELAARSDDPSAASVIFGQELRFRGLFFVARLQSALGTSRGASAVRLLDLVESMHEVDPARSASRSS